MRVLFDGVIYRIQKYGGIIRYFNSLIRHLSESIHPTVLAPTLPSNPPFHSNLSTYVETCGPLLWPFKVVRKEIIARRTYYRTCAVNPDIFHPTYYYSSMRRFLSRIQTPMVVTVYDLIHEKFPEEMDPKGRQRRLKKAALDRADAIICISESTRHDLIEHYDIPQDRIRVIYLGCDFSQSPTPLELTGERPYFVYVGGRDFYKNFPRLIQAFSIFHSRHPEYQLRCVGGPAFSRKEKELVRSLKLEKEVIAGGYLNDRQMQQAYRQSAGLVYPSLYEGFGMPLLEAMACETPVLTSNCSSLPEVSGNAALLFDPYAPESISNAMELAIDSGQRQALIDAGRKRSGEFSWRRMANETAEVYRSLIPEKVAA